MAQDTYRIVSATADQPYHAIADLEALVRTMTEQGWKPLGGIAVYASGTGCWVAQTLVK